MRVPGKPGRSPSRLPRDRLYEMLKKAVKGRSGVRRLSRLRPADQDSNHAVVIGYQRALAAKPRPGLDGFAFLP